MYLIALLVLILIYILVVYLMKYMKNIKFWNIIFASLVFVLYAMHSYIIFSSVGFYDWNFQNTLPVANLSPFMFSIMPIVLILPKNMRQYFYTLIALLFVGMFFSTIFNCTYNAVIGYKFHPHFLLDYIAHFVLSLFGFYLVKTKQVKLTKKDCLISVSILFTIITSMLILNIIFDTSFFGLSLNGKHNIYNMVLVPNSYISALIYYLGALFVLSLGFVFQKLLNSTPLKNKIN